MLLTMVFMVLLESANEIKFADLSNDLTSSKGNLYLEVLPNGDGMNYDKLGLAYQTLFDNIENSSLKDEVRFQPTDLLAFSYNGFHQIKGSAFNVPKHDYKHISYLNEKSLISGHLPNNPYEIVVDEYILEKLINTTILSNMITNYDYFIGKEFYSTNYSFTISGICRTKNPTIYGMDMFNFIRLEYYYRIKVIDIETFNSLYPGVLGSTLEKGQCYRQKDSLTIRYEDLDTVGYFDNEEYDLVINKEDYQACRRMAAYGRNKMYIVSDGQDSSISYYQTVIKDTINQLDEMGVPVKVNMTHRYQEEVDKAMVVLNNVSFYIRIVAIVIMVIALLMIILSTYLSMAGQIGTISVYRMLGYSRFRLGLIYVIELLLLSFAYTFLGGVLTYFGMFVLDVIPLIDFTIFTPIYQMLLVVASVAAAIVVIGIVPVLLLFKSTPAQINARYAKKTNNE